MSGSHREIRSHAGSLAPCRTKPSGTVLKQDVIPPRCFVSVASFSGAQLWANISVQDWFQEMKPETRPEWEDSPHPEIIPRMWEGAAMLMTQAERKRPTGLPEDVIAEVTHESGAETPTGT